MMVRKPSEKTISNSQINASNAANRSGKIRHVKEFGFFTKLRSLSRGFIMAVGRSDSFGSS